MLPNLMIILSTMALMLLGILARNEWDATTARSIILAVISLMPFLIPSSELGKDVFQSFASTFPLLALAWLMLGAGPEAKVFHCGTMVSIYGVSVAFMMFSGKRKGISWLSLVVLYSAVFSTLVCYRCKSEYAAFTIVVTSAVALCAASISGWFLKARKGLCIGASLVVPCFAFGSMILDDSIDFLDYLSQLVSPRTVNYLDSCGMDSVRSHLSRMHFIGETFADVPIWFTDEQIKQLESRSFVLLGHKLGWIVFPLIAVFILLLALGLILSSKRRKGLGKLLPLGAFSVVIPLVTLFLTNLGIIDAQISSYVPLITGNFATNLCAVLVLRLAITYKPDPECYLEPEKEDYLFGLSLLEECEEEHSDSLEYTGELKAFTLPKNKYIDTIVEAFSKQQIVIPFKKDLSVALKDQKLLFSRYSGDLSDAVNIFSLLKLVGDEHYMLISVAEDSNTSQLFLGVERITEALSNREKVDYCVCLDENVPTNRFVIQILSCTEA